MDGYLVGRVEQIMMVTDLQHFLDLSVDVPGPARRLAEEQGNIVRAATAGDAGKTWESALPCRRRPGHRRCSGRMLILRDLEPSAPIRWQCSVCSDEGIISNWADSSFDLRPRRLTRVVLVYEIVVSFEVAAALRELRFLGAECERLVFRIRPRDADAILAASEDGREELVRAVAAEANHEVNRRRRQCLCAAFEALSDAPHSV